MNKPIKILLTAAQSVITAGRVAALKNSEFNFHIVGADASSRPFKLALIDDWVTVPQGNNSQYLEAIKKIVVEKKIDVIVPATDLEVLAIAQEKPYFLNHGAACVCSDYSTVKTAINKAAALQFLKEKNILTPQFALPKNIAELKSTATQLGYPEKTLVFKPISGSGNSGVWLVQNDFSGNLLKNKGLPYITLEELVNQLKRLANFPEAVLMEYLSGEEYSVDGLANNGQPIYILPRVRVVALPGNSQESFIKENQAVENYVSKICQAFGFTSNFNIQLKYSDQDQPLVYEINPRISATIVANAAAGINLLLFGILQALKIDYPKNLKYNPSRMVRFWSEYYDN